MRRSAHGASHHVVFAGAERAPPQRRDVDRVRGAVEDLLGDGEASSRAMHQPVAAESRARVEILEGGEPADDRLMVGRHLIEARPLVRDCRFREQGQPLHRGRHVDFTPRLVHARVEPGRFVVLRHAGEDRAAFVVEIERPGEVDYERELLRDAGNRRRDGDLPPNGRHGHLHAERAPHDAGPRARREQVCVAGYLARRRLQGLDVTAAHARPGDPHAGAERCTGTRCATHISLQDAVRVHEPVPLVEGRGRDAVHVHLRREGGGLSRREPLRHHAVRVLQVHGAPEGVEVGGRAWLDHEWSSEPLAEDAQGWDWACVNGEDGSALMARPP